MLPCDRSKQVVLLIVQERLWSQIKHTQEYPGSLCSTAHSQIVSNTRWAQIFYLIPYYSNKHGYS